MNGKFKIQGESYVSKTHQTNHMSLAQMIIKAPRVKTAGWITEPKGLGLPRNLQVRAVPTIAKIKQAKKILSIRSF